MKSISVQIFLRIWFVIGGLFVIWVDAELAEVIHDLPVLMPCKLMLPVNAASWFMNQSRSCVKTGKLLGGIVWGGGCLFPTIWLRVHSSPLFVVYYPILTSLGTMLLHSTSSLSLLSAFLGCSVSIATARAVEVRPLPVAPFITERCAPQTWHSPCPCCQPGPVFSDCFITLGGSLFQLAVSAGTCCEGRQSGRSSVCRLHIW